MKTDNQWTDEDERDLEDTIAGMEPDVRRAFPDANSIRDQAPIPTEGSSKSHQRAPWFAVQSPTLTALGPTGRAMHAKTILARAESILARIGKPYQIDCCFALEEAAAQLKREGAI